jgi:hypothetical protein
MFPKIKRARHRFDCEPYFAGIDNVHYAVREIKTERKSRAKWARALANELELILVAYEDELNKPILDYLNKMKKELLAQAERDEK